MKLKNKSLLTLVILAAGAALAGCGAKAEPAPAPTSTAETAAAAVSETAAAAGESKAAGEIEVSVFAAASLTSIMEEFEKGFESEHPGTDILLNTDSSGKLLAQIHEGAPCDLFFSAGQSQVNALEDEGMLVEGTRKNVVNNQLIVITQPDSATKVTGLKDIGSAESIALADGSVPVGRYTRIAMIKLGLLPETDKPEAYTTEDISKALGGVEISEQGNVSKVRTAVEEGSCEVGTVYYSDIYRHEDRVKVLEVVSYDVSGNIIYPVCMVKNEDANSSQTEAAKAFLEYITGEDAKKLYQKYLFDTDVE
ncbi:MAG: molybdate ABC transporter substrate-binding protein [Lachnospiraceae bacterium]|nr:molybdate ABC transporter substrate-binding protein [Lachnospiraceae bacterium]